MAKSTFVCWSCRKAQELDGRVNRGDTCLSCRSDMRSCKNCAFYDVSAHHECREPTAEWVADKERGNFCGYFEPFGGERIDAGADVDSAKAKLEALFKKK
ncbi:MAG: hypothetical protein ACAI38_20130 [Myxococcota bacterium]|nr:hypothetical protein [Myxococcota bacterium]